MIGKISFDIQTNDSLPPLSRFKSLGAVLVKDMEQAVLVSINMRNLKYFDEIYGTDEGDWLIAFMVAFFCKENPNCVLASKSYVDHMIILYEGHNQTKEQLIDNFRKRGEEFLDIVNQRYRKAKIHVICGMYVLQKGDDFLTAQDNARYARRSIKNSYSTIVAYYSQAMRDDSMKKAGVISNFQRALDDRTIKVRLQPKYSTKEKCLVGAEALSRFEDENGEELSPAFFVPVLEKSGLISELDFEVIRQVVSLQKKWMQEGRTLFTISVNLSRVDFFEKDYLEKVNELVENAGIPKSCIEFELTETVVVENLNLIVEKLQLLRKEGYRVALDDFGSGYSSLYVLGKVPANVIKFDRGFVLHSIQNEAGCTILKNLVETFRQIHFEVLFEGVESETEEKAIVSCGCDVIQGFLYDRPLSIPVFEKKYIYAS